MNHQRILGSSTVLLAAVAGLMAESAGASDFTIEMTLAEPPPAGQTIEVRCLRGCDWEKKTIECVEGDSQCRSVITARDDSTVGGAASEPRPVGGWVCLGLSPAHDPASKFETVDNQVVEVSGRAIVGRIVAGSPAEQAGFKTGDVITSFNGVVIQRRTDFIDMVFSLVPGQPFEAMLDRKGTAVPVQGRAGMRMPDYSCAPFAERLLRMPAMTAEEFDSEGFTLAVNVPAEGVNLRCLKGCMWPEMPASYLSSLRGCWAEIGATSIGRGSCRRRESGLAPAEKSESGQDK